MPDRSKRRPVVFFDIGGTLGRPRLSGPPVKLRGIDVYPFVPGVLEGLAAKTVDLGIISNTGTETATSMRTHLEEAGIYRFFKRRLLIYSSVVGMEKDSPAIFELAAERAGRASDPGECVYVGEDNVERSHAVAAGWRVAPHPLLVGPVLDGEVLLFVRITVPAHHRDTDWRGLLRQLPLVPLEVTGGDTVTVSAIVPQSVLATLANAQFDVQPVGDVDDPATSDLYVLRDDLASSSGFLTEGGQAQSLFDGADANLLVGSSEQGAIVRIPADRSVEEFHFAMAAHGHNLKLVPNLGLLTPVDGGGELAVDRDLSAEEISTIGQLTAATIRAHIDRYSGVAPLGDPPRTAISSRHILHIGNQRATDRLAADLDAIGGGAFDVSMHSFNHGGRGYFNVEAELAGETDRLVLVTAHLDSTAASSPPYDATNDPAPGADDDGTGTAAVLAAAAIIRDLAAATKPQHTIRFVLFNAEEHGLIGSHAYARDAQAAGAQIDAVYQMDMIGYNVVPPATFELHAGYLASPTVQSSSVLLAERTVRLAPIVAPGLGTAQVYRSNSSTDRDPAEGRSDHAAFHQRGYPGVAATEDFFIGPGPTASEPNPNYHRKTDTLFDGEYAAGIARAVVAAAWVTAAPTVTTPVAPPGGTMAITLGSGATPEGTTDWRPYSGVGVYVDVDTTASGFTNTPKYFTAIGGSSSHWATTGATSIYSPTPTGFRVYVRWSNGTALTPETANANNWHIEWLGLEG